MLNISKNMKIGIVLSYIGIVVSVFGTIFITNRILDCIGDYNYGLYSFVNSITTWVTVLTSALTASYLRFVTAEAQKCKDGVKRINTLYLKVLTIISFFFLSVGLITVYILYSKGINLGKYDWNDSKLMYILFTFSILNISLTIPTSVFSLYVTYKKCFIFEKILAIVISIISLVGNLVIAYKTHSIICISIFAIVISIINSVANILFGVKFIGIRFDNTKLLKNRILVKSIFVFSGILLFNSIVDQINSNVDKTLLGIYSTPENVTIYQLGHQFATYMKTMSIAISGVFAPLIHELVVKKDEKSIGKIFIKVSYIQSIVVSCVTFGFLSCGYEFIKWWIGDTRIDAFYVGLGKMIINLCPLTLNASIEIQRAKDKHLFRAVVYFALAIVNIVLSIIFLRIMPSQYAVYACLVGTIIATFCSHWIAMNLYNNYSINLPVRAYLKNLLLYIVVGLGCSITTAFIERLGTGYYLNTHLEKFLFQGSIFILQYMLIVCLLNKSVVMTKINEWKMRL